MKKAKKKTAKAVDYKALFESNFLEWKIEANKDLTSAHLLMNESLEKEWKVKFDLAEKTLRHMEVIEKFLEIQTAIFKRLERKLK